MSPWGAGVGPEGGLRGKRIVEQIREGAPHHPQLSGCGGLETKQILQNASQTDKATAYA